MPTTLTARTLHTQHGTVDRPVITIDDDGMIASLSKYDFSRTKSLGFVYSMYVSNILAIYING